MRVFLSLIALAASTVVATQHYVGKVVASEVKSTIANDASGVIKAFSGTLPPEVLSLVDTALNITVLQNLSGVTNGTQLNTLASMVSQKMSEIEATVHAGFTNETFYGQNQGASFSDLRACIADVVKNAGKESGQKCLTMNNTAAVSDVKQIFRNMIDQYEFQLPMNTALALKSKVDTYLSNSSLIPPAQELVRDVQDATLSVAATTNAEEVQALYAAEACFFEALAQPVYTQAFEYQCNAGTLNDTDSTLDNVGDIYRATVNQYAGVLPPEIVQNIQDIGTSYLPKNISAVDNQTRNDVNAAVLSVVASTSGNTATLTYQLLDCLDLVLIPGAGNATTQEACLNSPTGVAASRLNIINGYIQQFYGVLPPKLILDMNAQVTANLANDTSLNAQKVKSHLDDIFTASAAGPEYVNCYENFENCVINAVGNATASSYCTMGEACKKLPFTLTLVDTTSPYAAAVAAAKKAQDAGKTKDSQRVSALRAAAQAAKQNAKTAGAAVKPSERIPPRMAKPKTLQPGRKSSPIGQSGHFGSGASRPKAVGSKKSGKAMSKGKTSKGSGSLRKGKPQKAAPKSKAKTSSLTHGGKKSKSKHIKFDHKGSMHKTAKHDTAVKKVAALFSCSSPS